MRRGFQSLDLVAGKIIDRGLIGLERGHIVFEAAPRLTAGGGLETRQREQRIAALEILIYTLFEDDAEQLPDLFVGVRLLVAEPLQLGEHTAGGAFADGAQERAFLDLLARNVE